MRTAEEIMKDVLPEGYFKWMIKNRPIRTIFITRMLNEARKEAIEECAERAEVDIGVDDDPTCEVDKQSILSLIDELK
jgi:hypothetical protein